MSIDWSKDKLIYTREDGSFVITYNGYPFHVPNEGEYVDLYKEVSEYANNHPEQVMPEEVLEPPVEEKTFSQVKAEVLEKIDRETSNAIMSGFDYEINTGSEVETLHFSYDILDQQNFADTANVALMSLLSSSVSTLTDKQTTSIPTSVTWNAYRNYTKETGGELVRLTLDAQEFLNLYLNGALVHKSTQMEIAGQRKEAVAAAQTIEELENI